MAKTKGIDWNERYREMIATGKSGVMTLNMTDGDLDLQKRLKKACDFPESDTVVDFGCGSCTYRPFLKTAFKAKRYVGYDISNVIISYLRGRFVDDSFSVYDGMIEPCDVIWSKSVFQHLDDMLFIDVLKSMRSALRVNGKIYIMDSEVKDATGYYFCRGDVEHFSLFTKAGLICPVSYAIDSYGIRQNLYEVIKC